MTRQLSPDIAKKIWAKVPRAQRICFFAVFFVMTVTHLFALTNKIPNWDELTLFETYGQGSEVGRWLLPYIHTTGARFSTPMVNGMILILTASLSACLIAALLELRSDTSVLAFSAVFATWISFCSMMMFMYTAHSYGMALLKCVLGVFLTVRKKKYGILCGIVLTVASLAVYQVYLPLAVALFFMILIRALIAGTPVRTVWKDGARYALTIILATVVYLLIARSFPLNDYRGASRMGQISLNSLPFQILRAFHRILQYFVTKPPSFQDGLLHVTSVLAVLASVILFFLLIIRKSIFRDVPRLTLLCVLTFFLPLMCSLIYVMTPEADQINMLMVFPYLLVYVFPLTLWEMTEQKTAIAGAAVIVLFFLTGFAQYRVINEAYLRNYIAYERIYALCNRIITKAEHLEGYRYSDALLLVGEYYPDPDPVSVYDPGEGRYLTIEGISAEHGLFTYGVRHHFFRQYLGVHGAFYLPLETVEEIAASEEFQEMPLFPADGSIRLIGNIWVVKLSDHVR